MARKKEALKYQINNNLRSKISFGESKHIEKIGLDFGKSSFKIFSFGTYNTYKKECLKYGEWLVNCKGVDKFEKLENTESYVNEYLQERFDKGFSVYTLKMERSSLSMLYGKQIEFHLPDRTPNKITRSRNNSNEKHYNRDGKYKDIFILGLGTGGRRSDLLSLKKDSFFEKDGHLFVKFEQSKGGRDRITYVREEYVSKIKEIINNTKDGDKLIKTIPKGIDVHSLRREYVKNLFDDITQDTLLRDRLLSIYPPRREYKTQKDKEGNTYTKEIKSKFYKDREGNVYNRDDIYILSQSLGHNRLDVSITHYLK